MLLITAQGQVAPREYFVRDVKEWQQRLLGALDGFGPGTEEFGVVMRTSGTNITTGNMEIPKSDAVLTALKALSNCFHVNNPDRLTKPAKGFEEWRTQFTNAYALFLIDANEKLSRIRRDYLTNRAAYLIMRPKYADGTGPGKLATTNILAYSQLSIGEDGDLIFQRASVTMSAKRVLELSYNDFLRRITPVEKYVYNVDDQQGASPFSGYYDELISKVEQRWLVLCRQVPKEDRTATGTVYVQFLLRSDGSVTNVVVPKDDVGEQLSRLCVQAVRESAPYYTWPLDMQRILGKACPTTIGFRYVWSPASNRQLN